MMKINKLILAILAITFVSQTYTFNRLTGRAIGEAVVKLNALIPQGAKVATPEEYRAWFNNVVTLMAQLEESKPITLTTASYTKPPLSGSLAEAFKKYSDETYDRVIKQAVTDTPEEAEKNVAVVKEVIEEAQKVVAEIGKKVTWADEVDKQLENVILIEDEIADLRELLPDVEELVVGEQKEELDEDIKEVQAKEKEVQGVWQAIKSGINSFFQEDPKLLQLDVLLEDNLKGKVSAKLNAQIKKQANKAPFVQINEYYTNLQAIEDQLDSYVKSNFSSKEQESKLKTIQDKIKFQYTNLARRQMHYANLIVYSYGNDIATLGKNIVAPLQQDGKEFRPHVPAKLQQYIPASSTFGNAVNTFATINAAEEADKSKAYRFIIETAIQTLKAKTNTLWSYLGIKQQPGDKYTYADMKNANNILAKTGQVIVGNLKTSVYTSHILYYNYEAARANLVKYFITPAQNAAKKDVTTQWVVDELLAIETNIVDSIKELNKYLPKNVWVPTHWDIVKK